MGYTQSAISWYKTFQERAVERTKTVEKRPRYLILSLLHISREKISIKRILALCFSITMVESEEQDSRGLRAVVLHTAFFTIMMVLSLAGNVLICLAFYRNKSLRTITNFYVLSLAVVDLMVAVFVFPSVTAASGLRKWPFSHEFCQFTGFLTNYWVFVSLSILALTAINRYVCVVKPQHYSFFFSKKKTMISICFVWIFMFIFYLVFIVALHATFEWQPNALHCRVTFPDENTTKVVYIGFGICTSLSMLFVLFGYCGVYRVIWRHKNAVFPFIHEGNNQGVSRAQEIKTSRVLFVAVFGFCVSWMPGIAMKAVEFGLKISVPSYLQSMPMLFSCISAWINPIIYGVMNRAMQREFENILLRWRRRKISATLHYSSLRAKSKVREVTEL